MREAKLEMPGAKLVEPKQWQRALLSTMSEANLEMWEAKLGLTATGVSAATEGKQRQRALALLGKMQQALALLSKMREASSQRLSSGRSGCFV